MTDQKIFFKRSRPSNWSRAAVQDDSSFLDCEYTLRILVMGSGRSNTDVDDGNNVCKSPFQVTYLQLVSELACHLIVTFSIRATTQAVSMLSMCILGLLLPRGSETTIPEAIVITTTTTLCNMDRYGYRFELVFVEAFSSSFQHLRYASRKTSLVTCSGAP
jgi:hypothetical protein